MSRFVGTPLALLIPGALLLCVSVGGAQEPPPEPSGDLVGVVVDAETGRALTGAFVAEAGSEWGSVTGEDGRFLLKERFVSSTDGPLTLTVRLLGYETLEWRGSPSSDAGPLALRLEPRPVVLEGITVMADRFRSRRLTVATSVRAYDREELSTTGARDVVDFIRSRAGVPLTRRRGEWRVRSRGRLVEPVVWVDEHPFPGGLDFLELYRPHEIYLVEVYGFGRHIRVYTDQYMERVATGEALPVLMSITGG